MTNRSLRRLLAAVCLNLCILTLYAQEHTLTVSDDISIVRFGTIWGEERDRAVQESPDGRWLCVHTVRADERDDRLHDQLRFYRNERLLHPQPSTPLSDVHPDWIVEESVVPINQMDATVTQLRWTRGEEVAFLKWTADGKRELYLADPSKQRVRKLTNGDRDIISFDIADEKHFVYTSPAQEIVDRQAREVHKPARVVGNAMLTHVLYPGSDTVASRTDLWSVREGHEQRIVDPESHKPLRILADGTLNLSISPDGAWIATVRPYDNIPQEWVTRYPLAYPGAPHPLRPGVQDLNQIVNWGLLGEYVAINTASGSIKPLAGGPDAFRLDWTENRLAGITWSSDSRFVFLPSTFADRPLTPDNRPCSSIVEMKSFALSCVRPSKRNFGTTHEDGYARLFSARLLNQNGESPSLELETESSGTRWFEHYTRSPDGRWKATARTAVASVPQRFEIVQSTLHSPVLVRTASGDEAQSIIFDPNPQLKSVHMGTVEDYRWSDGDKNWNGLLFRPIGYQPGVHYPLVIQTHGFDNSDFMPSGNFPSVFVAEELAAAGIMVLQVKDCPERSTVTEMSCNVSEYRAAIEQLSAEEGADADRVGLIGFSRTVSYVMKALVSKDVRFAAASITDGINVGYMAYLVDAAGSESFIRDQENLAGGPLLEPGMGAWLKNSPEFNTGDIRTPLRIVSRVDSGILEMWEPYCRLWLGKQPAEMIVLNTKAHLVAQPSVRRIAQEGNLDWFRFWLQGFVDPDPSKRDQYQRWEALRAREMLSRIHHDAPPFSD